MQKEESYTFWSGLKRGLLGLKDVLTSKDQDKVAYNMLLIGETGSGKTSFLNLLCNFKMVLKLKDDSCIKKLNKFHNEALENVKAAEMESATTGATYYQVDFEEVKLGLLDTPGFGDTRGLDQDKENVKKIVDKVNDVEYINCVCLIVNGRMARMTSQLQYVISEISAVLPKVTVKNTIVVFTNAKSQCDTNFCVDQITPYLGNPISDDKVFYFDNPWCILGKMEKAKATKDLQKAFRRASESLERMFNTIKTFEPIHTTLFMDLFLAKEAVERKVHELLLAVQNKVTLEETITNKKKEIDTAIAAKSINSNFETMIKVPKWTIQPTAQHNTVCELCNSNCHPMCGLPSSKDDREVLKNCACMQESNFVCTVCGHTYDVHMHAHFLNKLEEVETIFVNEDMKKAFEKAEIDIESLGQDMKERLDKEFHKIEEEISDHFGNLSNKIKLFEAHASTPSYIKLLHCQLVVINQRIKAISATNSSGIDDLIRTRDELEAKINLIGKTTTV